MPADIVSTMRCGVLVQISEVGTYEGITLSGLQIEDVFFEDEGFERGKSEVRTANGTQSYGWGIRFYQPSRGGLIERYPSRKLPNHERGAHRNKIDGTKPKYYRPKNI